MKKKKKVSPLDEYIKANRKGSREAEIENHGRPVSHNRVHVSKRFTTVKEIRQMPRGVCLICVVR